MECFTAEKLGRIFILKLVQGDDALLCIKKLIEEKNIKNAVVVSGVATFDRSVLHMISTTDYPIQTYMDRKTDVPLEVVSLQGLIVDGDPHIHCTISDRNQAYAGHLHEGCRILYLGEIVIQEILGLDIERRPNEKGALHIYEKSAQREK